jgi:hypothetical protein
MLGIAEPHAPLSDRPSAGGGAKVEHSATDHQTDTDGAALLMSVKEFLSRFIVYPLPEAKIAHVLWIAHTQRMDEWESTPRIAFLSPEPSSGKTRALEVTELLVPSPVEAINVSAAYIFRKVGGEQSTLLYDEIDAVFGPKAKENEDIRALLNAGHRRGAVAGRCAVRGNTVEPEEIPAYCAVALAGLGSLTRMRKRKSDERIKPFRRRAYQPEGHALRNRLAQWAANLSLEWPAMPGGIADRDADIWEALLAVADAAGHAMRRLRLLRLHRIGSRASTSACWPT